MSEQSNGDNFSVECSDDENYENFESNYRLVNGKRVWEPNGQQIGQLYRQLEAKGFIELRWQCPGRRSPSVHNIVGNTGVKSEVNDNELNNSSDQKSNELMNEFDFETEFNETPITAKASQAQRRRSSGIKKSQTNLTKVMQDIKKYQLIDQQTKRLSVQTSLSSQLSQPTTTSSSMTIESPSAQSQSQSFSSIRSDSPTDISQN